MDIREQLIDIIQENKIVQKANETFKTKVEDADLIAVELTKELMNQILTNEGFTLEVAILSLARTLMYLGQNYFTEDEEFKTTLEHVRRVTSDRLPYAIDNPQPCGMCEGCLNEELCENPTVDEMMTIKSLPLLAGSMLEYAYWSVHMERATTNSD